MLLICYSIACTISKRQIRAFKSFRPFQPLCSGLCKLGAGLCEILWGHDDHALVRSLVQKKNRHQCRKKFANNLLKHQHTDISTAYIISPHNSYHETLKSYCLFYAFNFLARISCKR